MPPIQSSALFLFYLLDLFLFALKNSNCEAGFVVFERKLKQLQENCFLPWKFAVFCVCVLSDQSVCGVCFCSVLQLAYCIVQFLEKDPTLTEPVSAVCTFHCSVFLFSAYILLLMKGFCFFLDVSLSPLCRSSEDFSSSGQRRAVKKRCVYSRGRGSKWNKANERTGSCECPNASLWL